MSIIDAHIHYGDDHPDLMALLAECDLRLFNICVAHMELSDSPDVAAWRSQAELYRSLADHYPARFAWCTSFDVPRFHMDDRAYADHVIQGLEADFAAGAVACKVWKNVGMEARKPDGSWLMIDDPIFTPIFDYIAGRGRTLLMHIAEPLACWQPLDPSKPHYGYYSQNPQWHMYNKPEYASHAQLIEARDNVVARHPSLRVVGAHLGSLEYDTDEVAARFDRYPNFAVDISARLGDLARQPADKVRRFFERYPDRILFGTDVVMRRNLSEMPDEERQRLLDALRATYRTHFAYFETTGEVDIRGHSAQGIGLSQGILDQFYRTTAQQWYPGL
jgi:hypothetical protein